MAKSETRTVLLVGPKQGMWRAGKFIGSEPVPVDVTAEQLKGIEADPAFIVMDMPAEDVSAKKGGGRKGQETSGEG